MRKRGGSVRVDFQREREWWDAKAPAEEQDAADMVVNRHLRWREIERNLGGVKTILDVGGGTGAFSIPLARRGFQVTHLDFSPKMLELARAKARGLKGIRFVEGNAVDLSMFPPRSFDLVLNMDGAISFCGIRAGDAIRETCRMARKKVIATVSNRGLMTAIAAGSSIAVSGRFIRAVRDYFDFPVWHQNQYPENKLISKGATQDYFGTFRGFTAPELKSALQEQGLRVVKCNGLGSLAYLVKEERIAEIVAKRKLLGEFLEMCERFDREIMPGGPGTRNRAGVIAVAMRGR